MSRIGKRPVELPSGVEAKIDGQTIEVKGPKGTSAFTATEDEPDDGAKPGHRCHGRLQERA